MFKIKKQWSKYIKRITSESFKSINSNTHITHTPIHPHPTTHTHQQTLEVTVKYYTIKWYSYVLKVEREKFYIIIICQIVPFFLKINISCVCYIYIYVRSCLDQVHFNCFKIKKDRYMHRSLSLFKFAEYIYSRYRIC